MGLFDAFLEAFSLIGRKPAILLPALITAVVNLVAANLLFDPVVDVVIGTAYLNEYPLGGLFESMFTVMQQYAGSLLPIFVVALLAGVINLSLMFVYARFAKVLDLGGAFGFALGRLKDVVILIVFFLLVSLLVFALYFLVVLVGFTWPLFTVIVGTLMAVAIFYLFLRLAFFIAAMAIDNVNLKTGLQASWEFTGKRTCKVLALFIIIGFINMVIGQIETLINGGLEAVGLDELLVESLGFGLPPFLVSMVATLIIFAYSGLVVPIYYLKLKAR